MAKQPSDPKKQGRGTIPTQLAFDYIKGPHFRSVRADGAIGAVTPNGHIHMALYSERPAIPRRLVHEVDQEGKLGKEVERESRESIVREMDVDVFLTLSVAKSIHDWLGRRIKELEDRRPSQGHRDRN